MKTIVFCLIITCLSILVLFLVVDFGAEVRAGMGLGMSLQVGSGISESYTGSYLTFGSDNLTFGTDKLIF